MTAASLWRRCPSACQGVGNIVSGLTGGLVVSTSLSLTTASFRAGGRTRVSAIVSGFALLLGLLFAPFIISSLPLVVLAAILVVISIRMVDRWSWHVLGSALFAKDKSRRSTSLRDGAIVLAVMLATVLGQPVTGVVLGVALSCIIFIADMSRPVVAKRRDGSVAHSKRVRSRGERDILRAAGSSITIWELQGVLFFGNASNLAAELRSVLSEASIVILDFRRITDVDTSGMTVLHQLAVRLRTEGRQLAVCGCDQNWFNRTDTSDFKLGLMRHFGTLDLALDWAETHIIEIHGGRKLPFELDLEESDLGQEIASDDLIVLRARSKLIHYPAGTHLCRAGDASEQLWIIRSGTVSIRVAGARADLRLAVLGPGCTVGEMGLLCRHRRSADVHANDDVEAYVLTLSAFETILREHHRLGLAILSAIARQLAQRLRDTAEELRVNES